MIYFVDGILLLVLLATACAYIECRLKLEHLELATIHLHRKLDRVFGSTMCIYDRDNATVYQSAENVAELPMPCGEHNGWDTKAGTYRG